MYTNEILRSVGALTGAYPVSMSIRGEIVGQGYLQDFPRPDFDVTGVFWRNEFLETILR
jgi:hypothetical protein